MKIRVLISIFRVKKHHRDKERHDERQLRERQCEGREQAKSDSKKTAGLDTGRCNLTDEAL